MRRLLFSLLLSASALLAHAEPLAVPGSGIALDAPPGLAWAKAGAALVDGEGATTLSFIVDVRHMTTLHDSAAWSPYFRHPPERLPGDAGRLYRRTRADGDGPGGWDGWLRLLPAGSGTLFVVATYTGPSPEAFERLRDTVLSATWQDAPLDPEAAFGVALKPQGLKLVPGNLGVLAYTDAGEPGVEAFKEISLVVAAQSAMPPPRAQPLATIDCAQTAGSALSRNIVVGATIDRGSHSYCEAWHRDTQARMGYYALVRPAGGGPAVVIIGSAPGERFAAALPVFREAVAALQFVR